MEPLQVIQQSIRQLFLGLPLILIALMGFLGIGLGNRGMLFMLLGQTGVVPTFVFVSQILTEILSGIGGPAIQRLFKVRPSEWSQFVPSAPLPAGDQNVSPSYWSTSIVFFMTYVYMNAYSVYNMPVLDETVSQQWRVQNRQARAMMILMVVALLSGGLVVSRYLLTGTETFFGMILSVGLGIGLGIFWYRVAGLAGARNADIFGVVQQMVPIDNTQITTCKPSA
jgi:hypothetical protein